MKKLQRGISTNIDFIRAMKERGQDVKAEFPAEKLRDQFDDLSDETKVTFDSTDETVLMTVNNDEPGPVDPLVTFYFNGGTLDGENIYSVHIETGSTGTYLNEYAMQLSEQEGFVLPVGSECFEYLTDENGNRIEDDFTLETDVNLIFNYTLYYYNIRVDLNGGSYDGNPEFSDDYAYGFPGLDIVNDIRVNIEQGLIEVPEGKRLVGLTTVLDDDNTFVSDDYVVEQNDTLYAYWEDDVPVYDIRIDLNGGTDLNGNTFMDFGFNEGTTGEQISGVFTDIVQSGSVIYPEGKEYVGLTEVKDDDSTLIDSGYILSGDCTLYAYWETIVCSVTVDYDGGIDPNGDTSMTNDIPYGTVLRTSDFPGDQLTPPEGKEYAGLTTDVSDPDAQFDEITIDGDITVYVVWDNLTFDLIIDLGNASYEGESSILESCNYGGIWTVADFENDYLSGITLPNHAHYVGITRVKDDDSTLIDPEETIIITESTTFYLYLEYEQN